MCTDSPIDGPVQHHRYEYHTRPTHCPVCLSHRIADICYGLPAFTPELVRRINAGRAVIAGDRRDGDPDWACADCRIVIYALPADAEETAV